MTALDDMDELRAAELAFGLLDTADHVEAEARLRRDPAFLAAFERWRDHAIALLDGPDVAPDAHVWDAIAGRLPANDGRAGRATHGWRGWLGWPIATGLATAAALALAILPFARPAPPPPPAVVPYRPAPPLVAVLSGTGAGRAVAVSFDRASRRLTVVPAGLGATPRVAELWVIPGGQAPRSLGLVGAGGARRPAPARVADLVAGATLAVSLEPAGGSPTGLPTGPVILTGTLSAG